MARFFCLLTQEPSLRCSRIQGWNAVIGLNQFDGAGVLYSRMVHPIPLEMIETGKFLQQRYRIDKQIGQGGMGAVYVATDERFGSRVAIKETLFMDDNFRKAIEREARLL